MARAPTLTNKESLILDLLGDGELFGLQLVYASRGELKRGTAYVSLHRLEAKGLVASRQEPRTGGEVGIPRRIYRVTEVGKRVFRARQALAEAWEE